MAISAFLQFARRGCGPELARLPFQACRMCRVCRQNPTKYFYLYTYLYSILSTLLKNTCTTCTVNITLEATTLYGVQAMFFYLHNACTNWICLHRIGAKPLEICGHWGVGQDYLHTLLGCLHSLHSPVGEREEKPDLKRW